NRNGMVSGSNIGEYVCTYAGLGSTSVNSIGIVPIKRYNSYIPGAVTIVFHRTTQSRCNRQGVDVHSRQNNNTSHGIGVPYTNDMSAIGQSAKYGSPGGRGGPCPVIDTVLVIS